MRSYYALIQPLCETLKIHEKVWPPEKGIWREATELSPEKTNDAVLKEEYDFTTQSLEGWSK